MDILYQDEEFCMEFSSEKIETELIGKLRDSFHIDIQLDYEGPNNTIDYISIEPQKDNLAIRFYGFETSLYVLDEKIMLVDDNQLKQYTYDHTYGNVVYSGKLRNLTHVKILSLLLDLVKCFINCTSVKAEILETKAPNMKSYHKNDYILSVTTTDKPQRQSPHRAFSGTKKIFSVVYSSLFSSKPSPTSTRIRRFRPDQSDPQRPCVSEFG